MVELKLGPAVQLLVAVSDLKVVRDVRHAIEANLVAAGGIKGALGQYTMPQHRMPRERESIAPRGYNAPHPRSTLALQPPAAFVRAETIVSSAPSARPIDPIEPCSTEPWREPKHGPLVPPWCMPLPIPQPPVDAVVKCHPCRPDGNTRGSLVDCFA